jgi:long-chain acyl-CoA synthetase
MHHAVNDEKLISIRNFFSGKNVLVTGSTGFLAKTVVEKFLRDLPEVGQIFLLIRPRLKPNGGRIEPADRLREEILGNSAFRRLRAQFGEEFHNYCESKITCLSGDLTKERLGLEPGVYEQLAGNLDVIINSAATVVFDERLDLAVNLNTLGPKRLMELARLSEGIYVHISTAYVSGKRTGFIPEKLLDPMEAIDAQLPPGVPRPASFDVKKEIEYLQEFAAKTEAECRQKLAGQGIDLNSEEARGEINSALVQAGMERAHHFGWNDTYTFTKFLGEQLVYLDRGSVPTVIVRPSIIESSYHDPEPGWLDGLRMADPIIIAFGKGRVPDFPANLDIALDIIPADYVVNGIMAATAHIAQHPGGFDLFTLASSMNNPLYFRQLYDIVREYFKKHSFTDRSGKPIPVASWKFPTVEQYRKMMERRYLKPARLAYAVVNAFPIPGSRKWRPRLRNVITKIEQLLYYVDLYGPYVNLDVRFETSHSYELLQSIHPDEREHYEFDPRKIRWRGYLQDVHIPGLKRNILRMDTVPRTGASQGKLLDEEKEAARKRGAAPGGLRRVPQTIVDLALAGKERFGNKTFVEIRRAAAGNGPVTTGITFEELHDRSEAWARKCVAKLGLNRGDRIALLGENGPEWALAYMTIARAGCTAVPLDRLMAPGQAAGLIRLVEAKALIISPAIFKNASEHFGQWHGMAPCLNLAGELEPFPGEAWPFPDASPEEVKLRPPSPESPASILFTSGTTLNPKGVVLTHSNFIGNLLSVAEVLEPKESDRFLSVLPMHHAFEFTCGFLVPLYGGSTIHHVEQLRSREVLETMKRTQTTVMLGVPRLFKLFMDGIQSKIAEAGTKGRLMLGACDKLASVLEMAGQTTARPRFFKKIHEAFGGKLRLFISGGSALDPELFQFFKRFGITICEGYGLTETAPVLTVNPLSAPKAGSVGPPVPGVEIEIKPLDDSDVGEVLARGPSIMQGYWQNPAATREVFENGWFKTGDLGRMDEDGYLHLTGRLKDVIITRSGKNIYPDEVEMALRDLPKVKEFCVLGLPDRSGTGEEVAAVIVPREERDRPEIEAALEKINRNLPSHERIARIEFQSEDLPKTSTLKVQRHKLRRNYSAHAKPEKRSGPGAAVLPADGRNKTINKEVACAVAKVAGNISSGEVTPDLKLQMDLGLDSIARMDVLQHLESNLGISLPVAIESNLFTVRDVIMVVEEAARRSPSGGEKRRRPTRSLCEHASVEREDVRAAMDQTLTRNLLRGSFDTAAGCILSSYIRVSSEGAENLPKSGPYILASNHCSHVDSAAVRKVLGKRAATLHVMAAKDYFFNTRLKSWFFSSCLNALPLNREEHAAESLAICKIVLDLGRPILLYPEGTRSVSGKLQPFKAGIGVLALELDVPLVPVLIRGTFDVLPKGKRFPRPGRVSVRFGPPVDLRHLKALQGTTNPGELYRKTAAEIRARVEALLQ